MSWFAREAPIPSRDEAKAELRRQLAAVENEAAGIRESSMQEREAAALCERRAMAAIHRGDAAAAAGELRQHGVHATRAAALEEDLIILEVMAETCREALAAAE